MLTRRKFTSFASCAICAAVVPAAKAAAQATPSGQLTAGLSRKVLSQLDGPGPSYVTIMMEVTVEPGAVVARHTHPGIESGYMLEGSIELPIQGMPTRVYRAGDSFQIPAETVHGGGKASNVRTRVLSTYVLEKGKPIASPA